MKAIVRDADEKIRTIINEPPAGWQPDPGYILVDYNDLPQGWEYIPAEVVVPIEVAAWRLKAVVEILGLKPSIDAALDSLPGADGIVAKLAWYEGSTIRRDSPLLAQMAAGLGLSAAQVDNLFLEAAAIPV